MQRDHGFKCGISRRNGRTLKGNNLSKWLRSRERNTKQQKIWKCVLVSLWCFLLAIRNSAGLVAFGSLLTEPHLPANCKCYMPCMESCSQKMFLDAWGTSTPQISLLCKSLKWQKNCHGDKYFLKYNWWAAPGLFFLFSSSHCKDLIVPCLKFQGDYVA